MTNERVMYVVIIITMTDTQVQVNKTNVRVKYRSYIMITDDVTNSYNIVKIDDYE